MNSVTSNKLLRYHQNLQFCKLFCRQKNGAVYLPHTKSTSEELGESLLDRWRMHTP